MTPDRRPGSPNFNLDIIAAHLEGLEETIISQLIDRAQYKQNEIIYEQKQSGFKGEPHRSLFQARFLYQERMDAQFGRFCVGEERPYHKRLPKPRREVSIAPTGLHLKTLNTVNLMPEIVDRYRELIPRICRSGDDGHYGSSTEHDVRSVQAIARRIHYGALYVAESKFQAAPGQFIDLIKKGTMAAIIEKLTRQEVEDRILKRIPEKVILVQKSANPAVRHLINPEVIMDFYRDTVMPLTKKGQAIYLLNHDTL